MADERVERPIRASQPPVRSAPPSQSPAGFSGNDPLAELARLIGQNDPFGEYGRANARRAAAPQAAPVYVDDRYGAMPAQAAPPTQYAADNDPAQPYGAAAGYGPEEGYRSDADYPGHAGAEGHEYYDEVPSRRRLGILAIAGVFALAVVGTAAAFGYRALFGSSASSGPPPVIKAEAAPSKIVPATNSKDPKSGKLIYDRVADRGQDERIVPREEQPIDLNSRPGGAGGPQGQGGAATASIQPAPGSGVLATEPKRVHTIAIRPDGTVVADAAPTPVSAPSAPAPSPVVSAASRSGPAAAQAQPVPQPAPAQSAPPPQAPPRAAAHAPSNAPLSLSPNAQASQPPRPARTAAAAPPTPIAPAAAARAPAAHANGAGGYAVQVSSQRSEAEAEAAFRSLQAKFPSQLGGKKPMIHRVDLGAKGIYYRAMVGPFGTSEEASQMCSSLKAAGGQCFVQRI
jgi:hypothetical protein